MPPTTDESAAALAISTLTPLSPTQQLAQSQLTTLLASPDPFPDIHSLLALYNTLYFRSLLLPAVELSWSPRLTLCAGTCELVRDPANNNKYTRGASSSPNPCSSSAPAQTSSTRCCTRRSTRTSSSPRRGGTRAGTTARGTARGS